MGGVTFTHKEEIEEHFHTPSEESPRNQNNKTKQSSVCLIYH